MCSRTLTRIRVLTPKRIHCHSQNFSEGLRSSFDDTLEESHVSNHSIQFYDKHILDNLRCGY